jgi:hypothetical protein
VSWSCDMHGKKREKCTRFWWESPPEGKRPLGRSRRRWEDRINMNLREIGSGCRVVTVGSG